MTQIDTEEEQHPSAAEREVDAFASTELAVDSMDPAFIDMLVERVLEFCEAITGHPLFDYQRTFARAIITDLITNGGEDITALFSRQSGKTETVADVVAGCMILFPKLATVFPDVFDKFKDGLWVGVFAPINEQAVTLYSRIISRLTSDLAIQAMLDPEIDDAPGNGGGQELHLKSGSLCRQQTANPRAKIESKSYHLIVIDEAQGADEFVVNKSIYPMGAFYNATSVMSGTPDVVKGVFYKNIALNKRKSTKKGAKQAHFEYDWRACARVNPNYARYVKKEMARLGEDSDEFQLAFALRWLLERGMYVSSEVMDELSDKSMDIQRQWMRSPLLVGVDPAKRIDSTIVTVVWVGWDHPDEFGFYEHRVLNWLELHGEEWEEQYFQICEFLQPYSVMRLGVDTQGLGDVVADRLTRLLPHIEVTACESTNPAQSARWKHLQALIQRRMIGWPGHAKARRLRVWKRFYQQMVDLEKRYQGPYLLAEAPEEAEAHDDYPDSLSIACSLSQLDSMPMAEMTANPFYT